MSTFAQLPNYLSLVTSEYEGLPLYNAFLSVFLQGQVDLQNCLMSMPGAFDLDEAVGVQLDAVGARVGIGRDVPTPITTVYFSWDTAGLGWDQGTWQGAFDPDTGVSTLSDEHYRKVIKGKIAANSWDGTVAGAEKVWAEAFGQGLLMMKDNQDMSETISWIGPPPDTVTASLFQMGYFSLKPAGVSLSYDVAPLVVSDTFVPYSSGVLSSNWTQITSDTVWIGISGGGSTGYYTTWGGNWCPPSIGIAWWNANAFPNDQYAESSCLGCISGGGGRTIGIMARIQPGTLNGYYLCINGVSGDWATMSAWVCIYKIVNGVFTMLGVSSPVIPLTAWGNNLFRIEAIGNRIIAKLNGVVIPGVGGTDNTFSGGQPGIAGCGPNYGGNGIMGTWQAGVP